MTLRADIEKAKCIAIDATATLTFCRPQSDEIFRCASQFRELAATLERLGIGARVREDLERNRGER